MNRSIYIAVQELRRVGNLELANDLQFGWENTYHSNLFISDREIGSHKPVIQWLADKYELIELVLGYQACHELHISDIKSLNSGIITTIHPKSFLMDGVSGDRIDEYRRHFAGGPSGDDKYMGVVPVCSYWAALIGCEAAGGSFACGIVAGLAERVIDIVSANLSDRVFNRFNQGGSRGASHSRSHDRGVPSSRS